MLEAGFLVAAGLLVTFWKLKWRWRMRILSNPIFVDVITFAFLMLLHWGTFSGVMAATIGALCCSVVLSGLRWAFGYKENGKLKPGKFTVPAAEL